MLKATSLTHFVRLQAELSREIYEIYSIFARFKRVLGLRAVDAHHSRSSAAG